MLRDLYKEYYETERSIRNFSLDLEHEINGNNDKEIVYALEVVIKMLNNYLYLIRREIKAIEEANR